MIRFLPMSKDHLRAVFDNNVLVSATLVDGFPRKGFDKILCNGTVLVSGPVLLELADVLNRRKYNSLGKSDSD